MSVNIKCRDFKEFVDAQSKNHHFLCDDERASIYIGKDKYISNMQVDSTIEKRLREIVDDEFKKLFSRYDELLNSYRFFAFSEPIKKDNNAFKKLLLLKKRETKFSSEKEYLDWINEE